MKGTGERSRFKLFPGTLMRQLSDTVHIPLISMVSLGQDLVFLLNSKLIVSILTILILKNKEDLLTTSFVVAPCDIVGLLEVWINELALELHDGLNVVELQWVLVSIFDL